MSSRTTTEWIGGLAFDSVVNGHHLVMDVDAEAGGKDAGPRPKPLLLAALSGCSGMDVVSILDKMKVGPYQLRIDAEADSTSEHPIVYHTIRLSYHFQGENLPADKIVKAVTLSTEKYCGVNAMLQRTARVIVGIHINDKEITQ